jgi:hypothetical protein
MEELWSRYWSAVQFIDSLYAVTLPTMLNLPDGLLKFHNVVTFEIMNFISMLLPEKVLHQLCLPNTLKHSRHCMYLTG